MAQEIENYEDFQRYEHDQNEAQFYGITYEQKDTIELLLERCTLSYEMCEKIKSEINSYSEAEADEVIIMLRSKQVNAIQAGYNYSQSDIVKHIKRIL